MRGIPREGSAGVLTGKTVLLLAESELTYSFRPGNGVPECSIRPPAPGLQRREPLIEQLPVEQLLGQNRYSGTVQNLDQVHHIPRERRVAGAAAKEHPGVANGLGAGFVQQGDEAATDKRIIAKAVVGTDIGMPDRPQPGRLGPKTQQVVIIIRQDDATARSHGPYH